jgi:hypothetical protein
MIGLHMQLVNISTWVCNISLVYMSVFLWAWNIPVVTAQIFMKSYIGDCRLLQPNSFAISLSLFPSHHTEYTTVTNVAICDMMYTLCWYPEMQQCKMWNKYLKRKIKMCFTLPLLYISSFSNLSLIIVHKMPKKLHIF